MTIDNLASTILIVCACCYIFQLLFVDRQVRELRDIISRHMGDHLKHTNQITFVYKGDGNNEAD